MANRGRSKGEVLYELLVRSEQEHLWAFFENLPAEKHASLLAFLENLDLLLLRRETLRMRRTSCDGFRLKPPPCIGLPNTPEEESQWKQARAIGMETLSRGELAVVTAAGGQGTRLGFDHSKGLFPVTPVKQKTFFQLFAEKIRAEERRYSYAIPWLIMTGVEHLRETEEYFAKNDNFGLTAVHIFPQGQLPSMDLNGQMMLSAADTISTNPDGHGGLLPAMGRCGALEKLQKRGIRHLSYCQVDNPLARPLDATFIGFHVSENAQMSSRCVRKAFAGERVSIFASIDDQLRVVEHSDLPVECATAMDAANCLHFRLANVSMHIFTIDFLLPFCQPGSRSMLPLHAVPKKIPYLNSAGHLVRPVEVNAYKLEYFIFDLLLHAKRTLLLEGRREKLFSPIRNPRGLDSPETSYRDQMRLFADWLAHAKVDLIRDSNGTPPFPIEIAPSFAVSCEEFQEKWRKLDPKPAIGPNFYLE
ncbi:MAG: UTP--glucose-1-phosphate uridylyltransferase [Puniceicoccales bacterium]|jgi:UDP-N-acetylglucosamine/UDP-N-acetylgalactosamine diphosphorylase|nr:UTP--glucose-1-phosphate uridylyltransferase [Puniceicoccales bacterium]